MGFLQDLSGFVDQRKLNNDFIYKFHARVSQVSFMSQITILTDSSSSRSNEPFRKSVPVCDNIRWNLCWFSAVENCDKVRRPTSWLAFLSFLLQLLKVGIRMVLEIVTSFAGQWSWSGGTKFASSRIPEEFGSTGETDVAQNSLVYQSCRHNLNQPGSNQFFARQIL